MPILIFVDGACSGNPGPGGWGAIIVTPDGKVLELGGGESSTTNNRMELQGSIVALARIETLPGRVDVCTDSSYVIQGITQWIWAWRSRDWKTAEGKDVANADLWKKLFGLVAKRGKENSIEWKYVRGHTGIPGNERVDEIAVEYSKGRRPELYQGPLLRYGIAIHDIPDDTSVPERKPRDQTEKKVAFSYLSLINDVPERHATWPECEARVKGRPGAKFKKAMSADEEGRILESWGVSPQKLTPKSK
jgi:ribonuclease HI